MTGQPRHRGFTLMELIIAMVIIGILTAIAIPNYTAYIQRSNRSEARSALLEAATWMERWRTERGRYDTPGAPGTPPPLPYTQVPQVGTAKYTIAAPVTPAIGTSYLITAVPTGVMTGDPCGNLSIDQTGARLPALPAWCWSR